MACSNWAERFTHTHTHTHKTRGDGAQAVPHVQNERIQAHKSNEPTRCGLGMVRFGPPRPPTRSMSNQYEKLPAAGAVRMSKT